MDVFAHVHVLWLDKDVEALFAADEESQDNEENRSSRTSSPLSRSSRPSTRPSTREVRYSCTAMNYSISKPCMPTGRIFLVLVRESVGRGCGRELARVWETVGRGCADRGHAPQSHVRTHTPTSVHNLSRTGPERDLTTHVATLVKTRSFAPPRRQLASQHHEALLLSSLGSAAGMMRSTAHHVTLSTAHHVEPSQVLCLFLPCYTQEAES